jgi:hypothetical protein
MGRVALHPAENRGYRELFAATRQAADHWSSLAERMDGSQAAVLARGAAAARDLISELEPLTGGYGLYGKPAAQGVGRSLGGPKSALRDRFLERNQAFRFAIADLQHVVTLLGYLASVSTASGNEDLAAFAGRWERKLKRIENESRRAAAEIGTDLDGAVEPLDGSPVGRVAHGLGNAIGTAGEWVDRRVARKG